MPVPGVRQLKHASIALAFLLPGVIHAGNLTPYGEKFYEKHVTATPSLKTSSSYSSHSSGLYSSEGKDILVRLGGYGSVDFSAANNGFTRFNADIHPAFLFRYKDIIEWNTLLWFGVDNTGNTITQIQYTYVDWFILNGLTLEAGKFLSPLGKFNREYYLPWLNKLPSNPVGFSYDDGAPYEDIGLQLKGPVPFFEAFPIFYALYIANGPHALFDDGRIEEIESNGYVSNTTDNFVGGGRLAVKPIPGLEIGLSGALGRIGIFTDNVKVASSRPYYAYGFDATYNWNMLNLRGEYIQNGIENCPICTNTGSANFASWYVQGSYRFLKNWEGVVRYSDSITNYEDYKQHQLALGLDYWIGPTAIVMLAYEFNYGVDDLPTNHNRVVAKISLGI